MRLTSSPSSTPFSSFCWCLRHLNKKFFITIVILILTLTGYLLLLQRQPQQPPKVGQTNLLLKLRLHQFFKKVNATVAVVTPTTTTTTTSTIHKNVFNIARFDDDKRPLKRRNQQDPLNNEPRRDWHNYEAIAKDAEHSPFDLGEFGKAAFLKLGKDADIAKKVSNSLQEYGFNLPLSDAISLERALPDFRHVRCQYLSYHAHLPSASIIVVYHNEQRSVLMRTLHSLTNRTPAKLLKEILLVDDDSDPKILGEDFEKLLEKNFKNIVKVLRAPKRLGLINARLLGARAASGEVLVFLDAHVEATHNWLPPLLEPIYEDPKTCTTPLIDTIHYENFAYVPATPSRGGFNWEFNYVELPLRLAEQQRLPEPQENPVMNGGLFAIKAKYFWQLGGYDEGLEIWGAEQFELSFKIWMCGGRLLKVPCARLGHLYRSPWYQVKYTNRTDDFVARNHKRIAEVWLDSYKEALYERVPKLYAIDAGDLSERKALRKNLRCKSFQWFLQTITPDFLEIYPPLEPVDFAFGAIQSMAEPKLCLDSLNKPAREIVGFLRDCSPDLRHPYASQRWSLGFRRDLRDSTGGCLEPQTWAANAPIWLWPCHNQGGNQFWYYDRLSHLLVQGSGVNDTERRCLEADFKEKRAFLNDCDFVKPTMKWHFGYVNETAMDNFFKHMNIS